MMIEEGALGDPAPEAIFGLHVWPEKVGTLNYRPRGAMAAADGLYIKVVGRQTHGAMPWGGVDPIVVASQIVMGLQTITARQTDVTKAPAIVTVGSTHGGTDRGQRRRRGDRPDRHRRARHVQRSRPHALGPSDT